MSLALNQISAVVLAGGFGTRIRHLLPGLPKPMAPVLGRPFLEWNVRFLATQGIRRILLATGFKAEIVASHFLSQPVKNAAVQCAAETEPLGTAGAFLNAAAMASERPGAWLIVNGDSMALAPLAPLAAALDDPNCAGAILGVTMADASRYGTMATNSEDVLLEFVEKKPGAGVINAGVYLLRSSLGKAFPARKPLSFEKDVFPDWIARGFRLKVCATDAPFLDIGTPESLALAEAFIRNNRSNFGEL